MEGHNGDWWWEGLFDAWIMPCQNMALCKSRGAAYAKQHHLLLIWLILDLAGCCCPLSDKNSCQNEGVKVIESKQNISTMWGSTSHEKRQYSMPFGPKHREGFWPLRSCYLFGNVNHSVIFCCTLFIAKNIHRENNHRKMKTFEVSNFREKNSPG